jgi:DNA-binding CsgD family transcriptional regulator
VGYGLTNKEIGDRLSISHRTVQGYLSRVFSKLGLRSRREIRMALHNLTVPHHLSRNRPPLGRAGLSPIEREIVDLVGDGLTNREIGDRLFISHRTVHGHLSRVFPRLGVSSRREIRLARSAVPGVQGRSFPRPAGERQGVSQLEITSV